MHLPCIEFTNILNCGHNLLLSFSLSLFLSLALPSILSLFSNAPIRKVFKGVEHEITEQNRPNKKNWIELEWQFSYLLPPPFCPSSISATNDLFNMEPSHNSENEKWIAYNLTYSSCTFPLFSALKNSPFNCACIFQPIFLFFMFFCSLRLFNSRSLSFWSARAFEIKSR